MLILKKIIEFFFEGLRAGRCRSRPTQVERIWGMFSMELVA